MATFAYKALDAQGGQAVGVLDGGSKAEISAALRNKGLIVLDINEKKESLAQIDIMAPFQRVKAKDLTIFSRQFATMVIGEIKSDVEAGLSLSDSLEKHPKIFSRLYVSMVRAGEAGGILDEVLNRLATQLEKDDSIRRAVKSAMVYPSVIASFAIIVMIGMVLFLIPIFAGIYKSLGNAKLPALTRGMIAISNTIKSWRGLIVLAVIIALVYAIRRFKRTEAGTFLWDRTKLRLPMGVGGVVQKLAVSRFSRTLGTLVSSGVPILQAIEITGQAAGNTVIERAMVDVQQSIKEGQSMTAPLEKVSIFPAMVTQMISVGEETGSLDAMLGKIADFYEDEVNASVKALTSIIEPIMMLGVGAIVGTVVISMYLPIFDMMNLVK
jgi:type IV pilus assembly protein PilC